MNIITDHTKLFDYNLELKLTQYILNYANNFSSNKAKNQQYGQDSDNNKIYEVRIEWISYLFKIYNSLQDSISI